VSPPRSPVRPSVAPKSTKPKKGTLKKGHVSLNNI
jgi:hypothetical protein